MASGIGRDGEAVSGTGRSRRAGKGGQRADGAADRRASQPPAQGATVAPPAAPDPDRARESVWQRPARARQERRPALDREQMVGAAIAVADEEGPAAISMRRIAARLGVGTMSLYWHVASKEDLLDLVRDAILGEERLPERPSGDWRADLTLLARQSRAMMHRHPWLVSLLHTASHLGPNALAHAEFSLAAVAGLGLDAATSFSIPNAVDDYVRGAVIGELEWAASGQHVRRGEEGWAAALDTFREQPDAAERYPTLLRFFAAPPDVTADRHFEFGLNCLLDGIAARIAAARE